jgi:isopentenyl-diphosphate delta-isomerase
MSVIPAWIDGDLVPVEKLEVHRRGLRHKAVSVFVFRGEAVLIQRRAIGKYHSPGLWANTCCSHPAWGESAHGCAVRRLRDELGITGLALTHDTTIEYRADVGGGLVEHELVDVYSGRSSDELRLAPDPDEVMETAWVGWADLLRWTRECPGEFAPWLLIYLDKGIDRALAPLERLSLR